jgi:hypothetical protein
VRPHLDNLALVKDIDDVRVLDRAETMCNGDCCAAFGSGVESDLDHALGCRVERRRGFVKEEDFGIAEESASDGDSLALSTRKKSTFCTNKSVESIR